MAEERGVIFNEEEEKREREEVTSLLPDGMLIISCVEN